MNNTNELTSKKVVYNIKKYIQTLEKKEKWIKNDILELELYINMLKTNTLRKLINENADHKIFYSPSMNDDELEFLKGQIIAGKASGLTRLKQKRSALINYINFVKTTKDINKLYLTYTVIKAILIYLNKKSFSKSYIIDNLLPKYYKAEKLNYTHYIASIAYLCDKELIVIED